MLGSPMSVPVAWVVGLLAALEPTSPWSDTFEKTAEAIARVSESEPLFAADAHGEERTATLLVALAWYESRLKPSAKSKNGRWYCLYQVDKSYFGADADKALTDPEVCTRTAVKIIRKSLEQCKYRAPDERLAAFTSGRCDRGGPESRYRMFLANKLLKEHPMPVPSGGTSTARAR
jgi:hypothetical protein